jgi:hypothetical protein
MNSIDLSNLSDGQVAFALAAVIISGIISAINEISHFFRAAYVAKEEEDSHGS